MFSLPERVAIYEAYGSNPSYRIYKVRERNRLNNFSMKASKRKAAHGTELPASKVRVGHPKQKATAVS